MNGVQNNLLQIVFSLNDKASAKFKESAKKITSSSEKVANKLKSIGQVGTVAFGTLSVAIGGAISTYQDQEKAEKRLEQIATQVTGATKEQIQEFKNLASATQQLGVVGDEVLIAGQSQIASFTKSSEVVKELTDDLADLAVATYGTNVSQEQSIQTANLLGKALQGNLGALTKTGILVSEDFKQAFESANNEQERAVILSQIIQDNYGGVNKAMRATSLGGVQALKNSYGDLLEVLGKAFVPMLNAIVERITPLIDAFGAWAVENETLIGVIGGIALAVTGLMVVLGGIGMIIGPLTTGFGVLSTLIGAMTGPIALVIAALAGLAYAYTTNFGGFKDIIDATFASLIPLFESLRDAIVGSFEQIWEVISLVSEKLNGEASPQWATFKEAIALIMGFILEVVMGVFKSIMEGVVLTIRNFGEFIDFLKNVFTGNWDGAFQNLKNIVAIWKDAIVGIFGAFNIDLPAIIETIKTTITNLWNGMFNGLKDIASGAIDRIAGKISAIWDKIQAAKDAIASLWGGGSETVGRASRSVGTRASGGMVLAGQLYKINELGTEYFRPAVNGTISRSPSLSTPQITLQFGDVHIANENDMQTFTEKVRAVLMENYRNLALGTY